MRCGVVGGAWEGGGRGSGERVTERVWYASASLFFWVWCEWWVVVFSKLVVSSLSSMRWLLYGAQRRNVTSVTVPRKDICNRPQNSPQEIFLHYGFKLVQKPYL